MQLTRDHRSLLSWRSMALTVGPGLVVMLADTEAGSAIAD